LGLEKAVRFSALLQLVGAGDICVELKVGFDLFDYSTAMTMIAVVVIGAKQIGVALRRRIMRGLARKTPGVVGGRTCMDRTPGGGVRSGQLGIASL